MTIKQSFIKEHNKQYFVVYTISRDTINRCLAEKEADGISADFEELRKDAFAKFDGLRDFLRDMLAKFGQTYVEDINGRGGLIVEEDKIEIVLWRFCDYELDEDGNYDLPNGCLITPEAKCIYFDEEDEEFFEVFDAICLAISSYGADFNTLIAPDEYSPFETETLSYMYEENESSEYTHKLFSFFLSDDQDLEECLDDYDCCEEGILKECCEISGYYEDFGKIVCKAVKSSSGAKFSVLIKDGVIGDDVTYISDSALYTMQEDYTSGDDELTVYGVKIKFSDLWDNEEARYYTKELHQTCEMYRHNYQEKYGDYVRDEFEFDDDEMDEDEQYELIQAEIYRQADGITIGKVIEQIAFLVNMDFDKLKIAEFSEKYTLGLPALFVLDVLEKMKKLKRSNAALEQVYNKLSEFAAQKKSKEKKPNPVQVTKPVTVSDNKCDESVAYGPAAVIVEDDWVIAVPKKVINAAQIKVKS